MTRDIIFNEQRLRTLREIRELGERTSPKLIDAPMRQSNPLKLPMNANGDMNGKFPKAE